jgi:hypothetical protein
VAALFGKLRGFSIESLGRLHKRLFHADGKIAQSFLNAALRFSANAAMPSFWSFCNQKQRLGYAIR